MPSVPISPDASPSVVLELLYRLKVRDAMSSPVITATPRDSLRTIQYRMRDNGITGVPVVEGEDRLAGLVSMGDIVEALDKGMISEPAESAMTRTVIVLEDDMPLAFATTYFNRYRFGRFPVLDRTGRLVGIVCASDIIRALLVRMNEEVTRLEERLAERQAAEKAAALAAAGGEPATGGEAVERLSFNVTRLDFENAGTASAALKKLLKARGVDPSIARRAAVASYELELNVVIHSEGGMISFEVGKGRIGILAEDRGPGIPDVEAAMKEGFSTANEWIRSLGFGAGMGLPNTRRVSDEFSLESGPRPDGSGPGTRVRCSINYE
jgi:CBS domain-containing protein